MHSPRRPDTRQAYDERRALPRFALHVDFAAEFLDDVLAHAEPEARPLAFFLGREKRFENVVANFHRNPLPRVADPEFARAVFSGERFDGDRSRIDHRLAGVVHEIEDDLLHEMRLDAHVNGVLAEIHLAPMFAHRGFQHRQGERNDFVERHANLSLIGPAF